MDSIKPLSARVIDNMSSAHLIEKLLIVSTFVFTVIKAAYKHVIISFKSITSSEVAKTWSVRSRKKVYWLHHQLNITRRVVPEHLRRLHPSSGDRVLVATVFLCIIWVFIMEGRWYTICLKASVYSSLDQDNTLNFTSPNITALEGDSLQSNDTAIVTPEPEKDTTAYLPPPYVMLESQDKCAQDLGMRKVALLFLVMGNPHHSQTWRGWFQAAKGSLTIGSLIKRKCKVPSACTSHSDDIVETTLDDQHLYSVYMHAPPDVNNTHLDPLWRERLIPKRVHPWWGSHQLAEATRNLLHEAFKDPLNKKFVLLCESGIPLYDPITIHHQLMHEELSRIQCCKEKGRELHKHRWTPKMEVPGVLEEQHWRKSSQWFSLSRQHVAAILKDTLVYRSFEKHCKIGQDTELNRWMDCISDEHYFPTVLASAGLDDECSCNCNGIAYTDWSEKGAHPKSFSRADVSSDDFWRRLRKSDSSRCNETEIQKVMNSASEFYVKLGQDADGEVVVSAAGGGGARGSGEQQRRNDTRPVEIEALQDLCDPQFKIPRFRKLKYDCYLTARKFPKETAGSVFDKLSDCRNKLGILPCGGDEVM